MKTILPWLLVVGLAAGVVALFMSNQKQEVELHQLQQTNQELEQLRATLTDTNQNQSQSQSDELTRLRAENQDVLRLRNEVRKLRDENQQLNKQVQTAQTQVQNVQAQAEATRNSAAQVLAQAQQTETMSRMQLQANACANILRQLDGAKQQWALENNKPANAAVTAADILPYLKAMPTCPAGGVYTLNVVGVAPTCSVPGHVMPKPPGQ